MRVIQLPGPAIRSIQITTTTPEYSEYRFTLNLENLGEDRQICLFIFTPLSYVMSIISFRFQLQITKLKKFYFY